MRRAGEPAAAAAGGRWVFWLKVAVSVALLAYLAWHGDLAQVWSTLRAADPPWVIAGMAAYWSSHALNVMRWHVYAREFGFSAARSDFARFYFTGLFVNLFMPGTIAGDLSRGLALGTHGGEPRRAAALGSVIAHRLSGMVALMTIAGVAALVQSQVALPAPARAAALLVPVASMAVLLWAPSAIAALAAWLGRTVALPAGSSWRAATARTLVVAAGYHALQVGAMICLARSLGIRVSAATLGLFVPLINAAGMVPVTVSGFGVREAGYVVLMDRIGVGAEQALALGLLGSGLVITAGLLGLPAFLTSRPRSR